MVQPSLMEPSPDIDKWPHDATGQTGLKCVCDTVVYYRQKAILSINYNDLNGIQMHKCVTPVWYSQTQPFHKMTVFQ